MGYEFALTAVFVLAALLMKRDTLTVTLFISWLASMAIGLTAPSASLIPTGAAIVDCSIALSVYFLWSEFSSQRARLVGAISLLKLTFHFGISAHFGSGDWFIYALLVNSCFILQCFIAGGWLHGMVDFLDRVSPRDRAGHATHNSKRAP